MNLFILDEDPIKAAEYYCDKHIVKIILEIHQMLRFANYEDMKNSYFNHPISQWVRESIGNYCWTYNHAVALCNEYRKRYGKIHKYESKILEYATVPLWIEEGGLTEFYQGVAEDCVIEGNAVEAYRKYYVIYKISFAKWRMGNVPQWFLEVFK